MFLKQIFIGTHSSTILLGSKAKTAILQYIEMQKENSQKK